MKTVVLILFVSSVALAQETNMPFLVIGTNMYHDVKIRKRNGTEAVLRFRGGLTMVKILDLPEPIRSDWYEAPPPSPARFIAPPAARPADKPRAWTREELKVRKTQTVAEAQVIAVPPTKFSDEERAGALSEIIKGASLGLLLIGVYFLPYAVASSRNHHNKAGIFVLNLFLGWTLLGWVLALVWAVTKPANAAPA